MGWFGKKKKQESEESRAITIPDDHFALLTMHYQNEDGTEGEPVFFMLNTSLIDFEHRDIFQWVLQIRVFVRNEEGGGSPTDAEAEVLNAMEDTIRDQISPEEGKPNALFLARETDRDLRTIFFAVYDDKLANNVLQEMLSDKKFDLPWEFRMESDQEWTAVQEYFEKYIKAEQGGQLH